MSINVGEVVSVRGSQVTLRIFEESNIETLFYDGKKYKGVSIREYIGIKRGFCLIVCIIEGEFLDENRFENENNKKQYVRKVEVKPIGYFELAKFHDGVKLMPMIKDKAFLLSEKQVTTIFSQGVDGKFNIGKMLQDDIPINLPWQKIFNSHVGIFGNTGSGKSNTLTKLYSELFLNFEEELKGKSEFLLIDFNGEYTGNQLIKDVNNKKVYKLSTGKTVGHKFPLPSNQIWNTEILALLFQATSNTQTPFLNRVVTKRESNLHEVDSLKDYVIGTFYLCLANPDQSKEFMTHLKVIAKHLNHAPLIQKLNDIFWFDKGSTFACKAFPQWEYFGSDQHFNQYLRPILNGIQTAQVDAFDELVIRINIQLLRDLTYGYVQFDHIQPLLKRVESSLKDLNKIFTIKDNIRNDFELLNVISLRACNQAAKK